MVQKNSNELYQSLLAISREFFGPASERFLTAQLRNHLNKTPAELTAKDIPALVDWLKLSMAVMHSDASEVERYITAVRRLSKKR